MASNRFGNVFALTTFGESHGPLIGGVIDGCPAGIKVDEDRIRKEMEKRRPGQKDHTSKREEKDRVEIVSGLHLGITTGAPLTFLIKNEDARSESYESIQEIYRPGHANYTYLNKYGVFDHKGGGRASARETAVRVAAGAIARQVINPTQITAKVVEVGGCREGFEKILLEAEKEGDSLGAVIECVVKDLPAGIGDPVYEKLDARLASAMLSIPATKGFEIGSGFKGAAMRGSEHNDLFGLDEKGRVKIETNNHGGTLGGISTGEDVVFRVAFKPTSSIKRPQHSIDLQGNECVLTLPKCSRHDVCVALRAPPIVEAMAALTICDLVLMNRCSKISY